MKRAGSSQSKDSAYLTHMDRRQFLQNATALTTAATILQPNSGLSLSESAPPKKTAEAFYLTDMGRCQPPSAFSRKPRRNHWRLLDYETDHFKGVMMIAGQNTEAPEVTCPLNRKGWHAIYFGIHPHCVSHIFQNKTASADDESRLQARLKSESTFSLLTHKWDPTAETRVDDFFWKYADLTGEDIVLRQFSKQVFPECATASGKICSSAWLAYIKLVPLSDREVEVLQHDRKQKTNRRLFAHNDAWDYHYYYHPRTEAEIRREIEPYRDSDFSRLYWEAASGERCNYPTKIGHTPVLEWIEDHYAVGERLAAESWNTLQRQGIDPFKVALEYAHEIGLEFHACIRTAGFHFPVPQDEWNTGGFYDQHPEWRGRDRQGLPTPRLSYAYPEVQQFVISLLKEMAGYPIDGVCLLYNRRPPLVEYEIPLVEGFRAKYGKDPRELEERDSRWLAYRSAALTTFMRSVRKAMNEAAEERGRSKPLHVSAVVASNQRENLYYGMDLETWIGEGLVDTMIPYSSVEGGKSSADAWVSPKDADYFLKITQGTKCKLALNILPRQLSPEEYRRRAHRLYEAGVEHLFFWDANQRTYLYPSWTELRRLGHQEEIAAWVGDREPALQQPGSQLLKIGDWNLGYVTPG
ncbi:MAG: hypothetical protein EXQ58_00185 [Acidobacteria bacterium]|nr:hypothetical protein [Acidobacteriota bacterium]